MCCLFSPQDTVYLLLGGREGFADSRCEALLKLLQSPAARSSRPDLPSEPTDDFYADELQRRLQVAEKDSQNLSQDIRVVRFFQILLENKAFSTVSGRPVFPAAKHIASKGVLGPAQGSHPFCRAHNLINVLSLCGVSGACVAFQQLSDAT